MMSGQQLQELVNAISGGYTVDSLKMAMLFSMRQDLAAIVNISQPLITVTFDLILWSERTGRTAELAIALHKQNPTSPALRAYIAKHHPNALLPQEEGTTPESIPAPETSEPDPTPVTNQPDPEPEAEADDRPSKLDLSKGLAACETMKSPDSRQTLLGFLADEGVEVTFVDNPRLLASRIINACVTVEPHQLGALVEALEFLENENAAAFKAFKALVETY